jgi:hypothetical protein
MESPASRLTDAEYRHLPRISNSDLTRLRDWLFGRERVLNSRAVSLGRAVHERVLEPHKAGPLPAGVGAAEVDRLSQRLHEHARFQEYARNGEKECVKLFTDPETGLDCKARLDLVVGNELVLDVKTTSARSYEAFVRTCEAYDYDRQAAFYLDSVGATEFVFVGIQKVEPFSIYWFDATAQAGFVDYGRRKYKRLLHTWKELRYDTFEGNTWHVFD